MKAGLTLVFPEYENWDDVSSALSSSQADILLISPYSNTSANTKRIDNLNSAIPELQRTRYGDNLSSSTFPSLKLVIQISHASIPGTEKFKVSYYTYNSIV